MRMTRRLGGRDVMGSDKYNMHTITSEVVYTAGLFIAILDPMVICSLLAERKSFGMEESWSRRCPLRWSVP